MLLHLYHRVCLKPMGVGMGDGMGVGGHEDRCAFGGVDVPRTMDAD